MLSSLPGSAVSKVEMNGVVHEFMPITGVKDVTEIIMNIKTSQSRTLHNDEVKYLYIEAEGDCVVTAANIRTDGDLEIINKDQVIATLSGGPDTKFSAKLTVTQGGVI